MSRSEQVIADAAHNGFGEPMFARQGSAPVVLIYRTHILPRSETFIREQAMALKRWRPVLFGENATGGLDLGKLKVATLHHGPPKLRQKLRGAFWRKISRVQPGLIALARRQAPDLIHAHFGYDGVEALPIAQSLGVPLLVTLHGADITISDAWFKSGRAGWRWRSYPKRLAILALQENVTFIAVSETIKEAAIKAGIPAQRIVVRHIGIDTRRFAPAGRSIGRRRPVILFMGRLVEKKGVSTLLEAFAVLRRRIADAELIIAGDGPERGKLAARAASIGGIRFTGAYSPDQAMEFLTEARLLCLPSVTAANGDAEGLGMVILEAQASGVPVVTSARGGATEAIIDGVTGFAFAEHDVAALEAHLFKLLSDDAMADTFSAACARFARQRFDITSCTAALETLYDQAAGFAV